MVEENTVKSLLDAVLPEISLDHMTSTIDKFNTLYRYTGYPQGEEAVTYISAKLKEYKVPFKTYEYEAYLGLPLEASVTVLSPVQKKLKAYGDVFSGEVSALRGELYYDEDSEKKHLTDLEMADRLKKCSERIVLSWASGDFINKAYRAGAKAVIHISPTKGGYIHHSGIGAIWGNPGSDDWYQHTHAPALGISREDGENLITLLKTQTVQVELNIKMDNTIRKSHMPVAFIKGKSSKFVLLSNHYDSWYEGITDNATSDAITLELARVLQKHSGELERSVVIAWWSGHSDGRYAGSAWFADNEWELMQNECVGHINLDLTGCKLAKQIRARTTLMEGFNFTANIIEKYTGRRPDEYIPMIRGADESFMGFDIPVSIMLKYEPLPEERVSPCPSGGPWWHTEFDTIDKLDKDILLRDAYINATMALHLLNDPVFPVQVPEFLEEMKKFIYQIQEGLDQEYTLQPVQDILEQLTPYVTKFQTALEQGRVSDALLKKIAGELVRLTYTRASRFYQDPAVGELPFPGLRDAYGLTRNNCRPEVYLKAHTTFVRQRNRLLYGLKKILKKLKTTL